MSFLVIAPKMSAFGEWTWQFDRTSAQYSLWKSTCTIVVQLAPSIFCQRNFNIHVIYVNAFIGYTCSHMPESKTGERRGTSNSRCSRLQFDWCIGVTECEYSDQRNLHTSWHTAKQNLIFVLAFSPREARTLDENAQRKKIENCVRAICKDDGIISSNSIELRRVRFISASMHLSGIRNATPIASNRIYRWALYCVRLQNIVDFHRTMWMAKRFNSFDCRRDGERARE